MLWIVIIYAKSGQLKSLNHRKSCDLYGWHALRGRSLSSGRAAFMGFCLLPLLYPSASDFQFRYALVTVGSGRAAYRSFWDFPTVQVKKFSSAY